MSTLPSLLDDREILVMSSKDIKCFFYLFNVPTSWHKFLAFGKPVPTTLFPEGAEDPYFLTSLVLPMGFIGSASIAQHVHRRVARLALRGMQPSRMPQHEMRRDRPGSTAPWLYRVYLDNYDRLEKMDPLLAQKVRGEPFLETLAARGL